MIHIRYFGGVEAKEVKGGEIRHVIKHITHIHHLRGIEVREIKGSGISHVIKHITHIRI